MNCNEFWRGMDGGELTPEQREHLTVCPRCADEFVIERELDRIAVSLPAHKAPDSAWDRIAAAIEAEQPAVAPEHAPNAVPGIRDRIGEFLKGITYRPSAALVMAVIVAFSAGVYFSMKTTLTVNGGGVATEAGTDLDRAEREYLAAIATLSKQVEQNRSSMNPDLYDLYVEKLAILDEYIDRCREAVSENEYNVNARAYLALAYKEKAETLREMAGGD